MHKDLLIYDILEKNQRIQGIKRGKEDIIQENLHKSIQFRDLIQDVAKKEGEIWKPITLESHKKEWQEEEKKKKRRKEQGYTGAD